MSIVLIFCVLAAAAWLLLALLGRETTNDPGDSVAAYSRAMGALDPMAEAKPHRASAPPRARRPQSGPRRRPQGGRPAPTQRPAARRTRARR